MTMRCFIRGTYIAGVALLMLQGCRLNFDATAPDADTPDAGPQTVSLACNTPTTVVASAIGTNVTAITKGTDLVVAWIEPGGSIGITRLVFSSQTDALVRPMSYGSLGSGFQMVSLASDNTVVLIAVATPSRTQLGLVADDDSPPPTLTSSAIVIATPHSLIATGRTTDPAFVLGGLNGANTELRGVAGDTSLLGSAFNIGVNDQRVYLVPLNAGFAPVNSIAGPRCGVSFVNDTVTARGTPAGFGTNGQCSQASGAHVPGRNDMLLVRHDTIDGDLNYNVAGISGTTVSPVPESRLRNPGNEARARGVSDGYWVSYETTSTVEAMHLDFAGTKGTPVVLGALADMTAHDVAIRGNDAFVAWIGVGAGLQVARLCP